MCELWARVPDWTPVWVRVPGWTPLWVKAGIHGTYRFIACNSNEYGWKFCKLKFYGVFAHIHLSCRQSFGRKSTSVCRPLRPLVEPMCELCQARPPGWNLYGLWAGVRGYSWMERVKQLCTHSTTFNKCPPTEGAFHGHSWEHRCQTLAETVAMATRVGFPVMFTRIEQVMHTCTPTCGSGDACMYPHLWIRWCMHVPHLWIRWCMHVPPTCGSGDAHMCPHLWIRWCTHVPPPVDQVMHTCTTPVGSGDAHMYLRWDTLIVAHIEHDSCLAAAWVHTSSWGVDYLHA